METGLKNGAVVLRQFEATLLAQTVLIVRMPSIEIYLDTLEILKN